MDLDVLGVIQLLDGYYIVVYWVTNIFLYSANPDQLGWPLQLSTTILKSIMEHISQEVVVSATETKKQEKEIEKIIDEVYDVLEKYGITGRGSRDFFWRQLAAEYACEIINRKMTEDEVLRDIELVAVTIFLEMVQRQQGLREADDMKASLLQG